MSTSTAVAMSNEERQPENTSESANNQKADSTEEPGTNQPESVTINLPGETRNSHPSRQQSIEEKMRKHSETIQMRHMRYDPLMIAFTVAVLLGGIAGYVMKGSVPSLVSGISFGLLLGAFTYLEGAFKNPYPLIATLCVLGGVMFHRYIDGFKFIPAGLISLLAFILVARHLYLLKLKHDQRSART